MLFGSKSIAGKVSFGVSILFIILLLVLAFINYSDSKDNSTKLLVSERQKVIQASENLMDSRFGSDINTINNLNDYISKNDYSQQEIEDILKIIDKTSNFELLYVGYQKDGMMIRSNGNSGLPSTENGMYDPRNRPWYINAVKENRVVITEPFISKTTGQFTISISKPIYKNSELIGVISGQVALNEVNKKFAELGNA